MTRLQQTLSALIGALVVGLTGAQSGAAQTPSPDDLVRTARPTVSEPASEPAPERPPAPPAVLAAGALQRAAAFRAYMTSAASISPDFQSGDEVARGLKIAAGFEPRQLQEGATAYVAVVALQQPDFVAQVRRFAVDPVQRRELARMLIERPVYATAFEGSDRAAGAAIAALDRLGARLMVKGRTIERAAYTVQAQPWSKDAVIDRAQRLVDAKALAEVSLSVGPADIEALQRGAVVAAMSQGGKPAAPPYTQTIERGLAVAILTLLGEGGDDHEAEVMALLAADEPDPCLSFSKLMLYQCLAGSDQGHYEDMFCLAKHGLADTGSCMVQTAGSSAPVFVDPFPPPQRAISPGGLPPPG